MWPLTPTGCWDSMSQPSRSRMLPSHKITLAWSHANMTTLCQLSSAHSSTTWTFSGPAHSISLLFNLKHFPSSRTCSLTPVLPPSCLMSSTMLVSVTSLTLLHRPRDHSKPSQTELLNSTESQLKRLLTWSSLILISSMLRKRPLSSEKQACLPVYLPISL